MNGGIALDCYGGGVIGWQLAKFDNVVVKTEVVVATDAQSWDQVKALYRCPAALGVALVPVTKAYFSPPS